MKKCLLFVFVVMLTFISCENNESYSVDSNNFAIKEISDTNKYPQIYSVRHLGRGIHGSQAIEFCFIHTGEGYIGAPDVWFRESGRDENSWIHLGYGYNLSVSEDGQGKLFFATYDFAYIPNMEYNHYYDFKVGSIRVPSDVGTRYYGYFHHEELSSDKPEYQKRKVYLNLSVNPPSTNWRIYHATIVMKDNSAPNESVVFNADFGQTAARNKLFEAAFYCREVYPPYGQNLGTITVTLECDYSPTPIIETKTFGFGYAERYVNMNITIW